MRTQYNAELPQGGHRVAAKGDSTLSLSLITSDGWQVSVLSQHLALTEGEEADTGPRTTLALHTGGTMAVRATGLRTNMGCTHDSECGNTEFPAKCVHTLQYDGCSTEMARPCEEQRVDIFTLMSL